MTNHAPTLETCIKLHDWGFPQKTLFCWHNVASQPAMITQEEASSGKYTSMPPFPIAAPLLTEILEQLPATTNIYLRRTASNPSVELSYGYSLNEPDKVAYSNNPAEAAALLWLERMKNPHP